MIYSSKLPYGLRIEGNKEKLVHISEIKPSEYGLRCNCVCPSCGVQLQAKLPRHKKDYTPRFAHHDSETCDYATETSLHLKAKEIIENEGSIVLPEVIATYKDLVRLLHREQRVKFDYIITENRVGDIIPDLIAYKDDKQLIIEIKFTHGIDSIKLEKIKKLGISTIEIDLSDMDVDFEPIALRERIIECTEYKSWIYNTHAEKEKEKLKREYQSKLNYENESRRKETEKRHNKSKEEEQKRKEKVNRIEGILKQGNQNALRKKWDNEFTLNPIWIKYSKEMNISINNIPRYLNIEIQGDIVFGCDRRVWQTYIFSNYIHNNLKRYRENVHSLCVKDICEDVRNVFYEYLNRDLMFTKDISESIKVPDLTQVVFSYLSKLVKYNLLFNQEVGNHIYYAKFVLHDPIKTNILRFIPKSISEYKILEEMIFNSKWIECREEVKRLLIKYNEREFPIYFDLLINGIELVIDQTNRS